jgi:hypothetical protein
MFSELCYKIPDLKMDLCKTLFQSFFNQSSLLIHAIRSINDDEEEEEENLPIINKTSHPTQRGRKRYKMEGTQVLASK